MTHPKGKNSGVTTPRTLLLVPLLLAGAGLGTAAVLVSERGAAESSETVSAVAPELDGPVAVLREWDQRRAGAWAAGDLDGLRSLYVPGSAAGVRDAAMLAAWRDRGLRVEGMQTQLLAARVSAQTADRLVLVVTDRLLGAVATRRGHRWELPADQATTRRVVVERVGGQWRVSRVSAQP